MLAWQVRAKAEMERPLYMQVVRKLFTVHGAHGFCTRDLWMTLLIFVTPNKVTRLSVTDMTLPELCELIRSLHVQCCQHTTDDPFLIPSADGLVALHVASVIGVPLEVLQLFVSTSPLPRNCATTAERRPCTSSASQAKDDTGPCLAASKKCNSCTRWALRACQLPDHKGYLPLAMLDETGAGVHLISECLSWYLDALTVRTALDTGELKVNAVRKQAVPRASTPLTMVVRLHRDTCLVSLLLAVDPAALFEGRACALTPARGRQQSLRARRARHAARAHCAGATVMACSRPRSSSHQVDCDQTALDLVVVREAPVEVVGLLAEAMVGVVGAPSTRCCGSRTPRAWPTTPLGSPSTRAGASTASRAATAAPS